MDAPKRIWAWVYADPWGNELRWFEWEDHTPQAGEFEYILATEHERLLSEARNKALEDAAQCCEREADRCDDAAIWGGSRTYVNNCKAAAYAMRDRANAIRAMKGER